MPLGTTSAKISVCQQVVWGHFGAALFTLFPVGQPGESKKTYAGFYSYCIIKNI